MWYADTFALIIVKLVGCTKYGLSGSIALFSFHLVYAYKTSQVLWCFIYTLIQTSNYKSSSYHQTSCTKLTSSSNYDFIRNFLCDIMLGIYREQVISNFCARNNFVKITLVFYKHIGLRTDVKLFNLSINEHAFCKIRLKQIDMDLIILKP